MSRLYSKIAIRLASIATLIALTGLTANATTRYHIQTSRINTSDYLNHPEITSITDDMTESLWVGTASGFGILTNGNAVSFGFTDDMRPLGKVFDIAVRGDYALIAAELGLLKYDKVSGKFTQVRGSDNITGESIASHGDDVYIFDSANNAILKYKFSCDSLEVLKNLGNIRDYSVQKILVKENGKYLYISDAKNGILRFDIAASRLSHTGIQSENIVAAATMVDSENTIWISRYGKGVTAYRSDRDNVEICSYNTDNGLASNFISCMYEFSDGSICFGSDGGGLSILDKVTGKIDVIKHPDILCAKVMISTNNRDLLVGTTYNGLSLLKLSQFFSLNNEYAGKNGAFPRANIISGCDGGNGKIWLGTAGNGVYGYDEEKSIVRQMEKTDGLHIVSVCPLDKSNLLIATPYNGLHKLNIETGVTTPWRMAGEDLRIRENKSGHILLYNTGENSILMFNVGGTHYRYDIAAQKATILPLETDGFSDNVTNVKEYNKSWTLVTSSHCIYEIENSQNFQKQLYRSPDKILASDVDEDGNVWFTTRKGLYKYARRTNEVTLAATRTDYGTFIAVAIKNGSIYLAGDAGHIWKYDSLDGSLYAYSEEDGLSSDTYYWNNAFCSERGTIYFPCSGGIVILDADEDIAPIREDSIAITCVGAVVNGKKKEMRKNLLTVSPRGILESINFAISSHIPYIPIEYKWRVLNKNGMEIKSGKTSLLSVPLSMLAPGYYTLETSFFGRSGWTEWTPATNIKIKRTFFNSPWMGVVIGIFLILVMSAIFLLIGSKKRKAGEDTLHKALEDSEFRKEEAMKNFLLEWAKTFDEPMSNALRSMNELIDNRKEDQMVQEKLGRVSCMTDKLVNQIHLILENDASNRQPIPLDVETIELNKSIREFINIRMPESSFKNVKIDFIPDESIQSVNADEVKLEIAFDTLLDNAVRGAGATEIVVSTSVTSLGYIRINLTDNGSLYEGNYQNLFNVKLNKRKPVTSGLNMAMSRKMIELMGGQVDGSIRDDGKGSIFFIELPSILKKSLNEDAEYLESDSEIVNTANQTVLVVDDQQDVLDFLSEEFEGKFKTIFTAHNGREALEVVKDKMPGIIVSDIMMPEMNGFELCKAVKSNIDISHIPVILLTASSDPRAQEMGYKMGADVFIPKPFNVQTLLSAIQNLIRKRIEVRRQFAASSSEITSEQTFSAADEKFVAKLNKFILDNISNPDLSVDMILGEMCVSRTTLFNKMNSIMGVSVAKYIRKMRIERARELMTDTEKTVFDIAIELGFTDSQYFSTVFKQETGETPTQFRSRIRGGAKP